MREKGKGQENAHSHGGRGSWCSAKVPLGRRASSFNHFSSKSSHHCLTTQKQVVEIEHVGRAATWEKVVGGIAYMGREGGGEREKCVLFLCGKHTPCMFHNRHMLFGCCRCLHWQGRCSSPSRSPSSHHVYRTVRHTEFDFTVCLIQSQQYLYLPGRHAQVGKAACPSSCSKNAHTC